VVELAAQSVNEDLLALYTARNPRALDTLVNREQTEFRALPAEVLRGLKQASEQVVAELGASDEFSRRVYGSWLEFREQCRQWHRISERAFLEARD
jgi:TRAP-type mannitol/chloroaromatic compound transport system substrate-binding protein